MLTEKYVLFQDQHLISIFPLKVSLMLLQKIIMKIVNMIAKNSPFQREYIWQKVQPTVQKSSKLKENIMNHNLQIYLLCMFLLKYFKKIK
jgi:hypothetical protein